MPRAELPSTLKGWMVAIGAGIVGFICGFIFITIANRTIA
jgi:hypothetical protein